MVEAQQRKKIMIIDDSEIVLAVAQRTLESAGFEVITHPRPAGCIALILQELPDVLLIDVNMPGLNGDTVVRMLGSTQINSEMIVLLHSSLQDSILAEKAKSSKAHGYIRKSENPQDLVREVSRWVRQGVISGSNYLRRDSGALVRTSSGTMPTGKRTSDSPEWIPIKSETAGRLVRKLLLVDHDMVALSEYRHLTRSITDSIEYALSGTEALRRVQSDAPPDIVVLGKLVGSPSVEDVLQNIARLGSRWKSRCIVLHEDSVREWPGILDLTRLRRPITEAALCRAIQGCAQRAS